jgi:HJR/Mrr/RecB family endonuclease
MTSESEVPSWMSRYPPAEISPREFEQFVAELFASLPSEVTGVQVEVHDRVEGRDGAFEFDATVRCEWRGLSFLILLEAKRHASAIKREDVQVLHQKLLSVGAQKAVCSPRHPFKAAPWNSPRSME